MMIPYGKTQISLDIAFPSVEVLISGAIIQDKKKSENQIVLEAMADPISSPPLYSLAKNKNSAVIIISDHTRPVPSRHIIPFMLRELRTGNPGINVTLLVATGSHREMTRHELLTKLGRGIVENERILIHDCMNGDELTDLGRLPSGARLVMNKAAAETDLLIAEGFIEPHFFAGFSGGRKSVLPGICGRETVLGNHCAAFIQSEYARSGVLQNNPIQADMIAACRMAKLQYIVNVIIDENKRVIAAYAGHPVIAHEKGCADLLRRCRVQPKKKGDIVISSNGGAPLDQNIYQAVKGLTTAAAAAARGAVLILCAECADGTGGEAFYKSMRDCVSIPHLLDEILKTLMEETKPDQWQYQILARILNEHTVIFVTRPELRKIIQEMKMEYAPDIEQALQAAWNIKGKDCHHIVIPDGVSVIV